MLTKSALPRCAALAIVSAISIFAFTATAGAVTIGSKCTSNSGAPSTLFTTGTSSGESYVVPFNGVLTSWGVDRTNAGSIGMVAAVLGNPAGGTDWTVTGATTYQTAPAGAVASFSARVAVRAGQTLGSSAFNSEPVMCNTGSAADVGVYGSAYSVGETFPTSDISNYKAAIWATIEPDGDGDGYGDETQDKCPQSAAFQNPCPVLSISQQLSASKTQINILATSSIDAQLVAVAVVSVPKIGKKKARRVTVQGTGQQFVGGKLKTIRLKLPSSVKSALKSKGKLGATVTLSGSGLANKATVTGKVTIRQK